LEQFLELEDVGLERQFQQTLLDACEFKKAGLLPGIMRMSEAAYIEEPDAFMHRISEYWKIFYRQT